MMISDRGLVYDIRRKFQCLSYKILGPSLMSKIYFKIVMKQKLNLDNPITFNEKIQWYKLNYCSNNDNIIRCSDKLRVREYLDEKGLLQYQVPLIGYWYDVDSIKWDELPNKFAIKCNHGCAYNIICTNKKDFDINKAKKQLKIWMKQNFGEFNCEMHYDKIKKSILCEEFLDNGGKPMVDYKFHCFNGSPKFIEVCSDRENTGANYNYRDLSWNILKYSKNEIREIKKPLNLELMTNISKMIAKDFPYVRVDFYEINTKIMIGELTFTPAGGLDSTLLPDADILIGNMLDLGEIK